MERIFKTELAGRPIVVETGKLAQFTNGDSDPFHCYSF